MNAVVGLFAVAAFASVAALGQGQFFFNTHDLFNGDDVRFVMPDGSYASGPDLFVEVLAGPDESSLQPLVPLLPLNRAGLSAGYTYPLSLILTVPGMGQGSYALVGYRAFEGVTWDSSTVRSALQLSLSRVYMQEPAGVPPYEVSLGTRTVMLIPEPSVWTLVLLGFGVVVIACRTNECTEPGDSAVVPDRPSMAPGR